MKTRSSDVKELTSVDEDIYPGSLGRQMDGCYWNNGISHIQTSKIYVNAMQGQEC